MTVTCVLAPYGDAIPPANLAVLNPGESSTGQNFSAHKTPSLGGFSPVLPQPVPSTFHDVIPPTNAP
jgi:hypothetical protein